MPSSGYRWDSLGAGPGIRPTATAWELKWWILLAVLTSCVIHAGLLFVAARIRVPVPAEPAARDSLTGVMDMRTVDPVTLPEEVLREIAPDQPDLSRDIRTEPAVTEVPDVSKIAEAVHERDVVLTPAIESPAANVTLSTPAPGRPGDLIDDVAEIRSAPEDLAGSLISANTALKDRMMPADDQVTIEIEDGSPGSGDLSSDVINSLKKGTGGNGGIDGFMNLDDLVSYKGPITGDFKTMLKTDLLFEFNSATLHDSARLSLLKLGYIIQKNPDAIFRLVGHTDTIGDEAFNQRLSEARARAVRDWLVESLQIDARNIVVEGRGEREPLPDVNPNGTPEEQALNRRVEIHKTNR